MKRISVAELQSQRASGKGQQGALVACLVAGNHVSKAAVKMARMLVSESAKDSLLLIHAVTSELATHTAEKLITSFLPAEQSACVQYTVLVQPEGRGLREVIMEALNALQPSLLVIGSAGLCNDTLTEQELAKKHGFVPSSGNSTAPVAPLGLVARRKPARTCFAMSLAQALHQKIPLLIVKANSVGTATQPHNPAPSLRAMLDLQSTSRHSLEYLLGRLQATRGDSVVLAVSRALESDDQVRQTAVRMLTTFSVQCQVSTLGGARRRLLKDASHRALPVAVVADDIDILLVQAPRSRDLSPSIIDLLISARTSLLVWPPDRRADGTMAEKPALVPAVITEEGDSGEADDMSPDQDTWNWPPAAAAGGGKGSTTSTRSGDSFNARQHALAAKAAGEWARTYAARAAARAAASGMAGTSPEGGSRKGVPVGMDGDEGPAVSGNSGSLPPLMLHRSISHQGPLSRSNPLSIAALPRSSTLTAALRSRPALMEAATHGVSAALRFHALSEANSEGGGEGDNEDTDDHLSSGGSTGGGIKGSTSHHQQQGSLGGAAGFDEVEEDRPSWGSSAATQGLASEGGANQHSSVHEAGSSSMLPELAPLGGATRGPIGRRGPAAREIGVAFGRTWSQHNNRRAGSAGSQGSAERGHFPGGGITEAGLQEATGRAISRLPTLPSFTREMRAGITPAGVPVALAPLPAMRSAPIPAK